MSQPWSRSGEEEAEKKVGPWRPDVGFTPGGAYWALVKTEARSCGAFPDPGHQSPQGL